MWHSDAAASAAVVVNSIAVGSACAQPCAPGWDTQFGTAQFDGEVNDYQQFDDGTGMALCACGAFTSIDGQPVGGIARWDGTHWESLAEGFDPVRSDGVHSLLSFDDGSGPALYAGGGFTHSGQRIIQYIARWDGRAWSTVGDGGELTYNRSFSHVDEMAVFDDGPGPALSVTGQFTTILNGEWKSGLARWNGAERSVPGVGLAVRGQDHADGIAVYGDGSGPALWIGGRFHVDGSEFPYGSVASWDGSQWRVPDQWPDNWVNALASYNDGFGEAVYVGGVFSHLYPSIAEAHGVTRWTTPHMALDHTPLVAGQPAQFSTTCSTPAAGALRLPTARAALGRSTSSNSASHST